MSNTQVVTVPIDPELDPALEEEFYVEPPELKARLDVEENQEPTGSVNPNS